MEDASRSLRSSGSRLLILGCSLLGISEGVTAESRAKRPFDLYCQCLVCSQASVLSLASFPRSG